MLEDSLPRVERSGHIGMADDVRHLLADGYLRGQQAQSALDVLAGSHTQGEQFRTVADTLGLRADAMAALGRGDEAESLYARAVEGLRRRDQGLALQDMLLRLARCLRRLKRFDQARAAYQEVFASLLG